MLKHTASLSPRAIDEHVGARVRQCRLTRGLSQTEVGSKLAVTFQQIQKNEKGTNRIGASRLHQLAQLFEVPVGDFFQGLPAAGETAPTHDPLAQLGASRQGVELAQAFTTIADPGLRTAVVNMVAQIATGKR